MPVTARGTCLLVSAQCQRHCLWLHLAVQEDGVSVPERYLGLTMPHEQDDSQPAAGSNTADGQPAPLPPYLERLAQYVSTHVDLDLLLQLAATIGPAADNPLQQAQQQEVSRQQLRAGCCGVNTLTGKVPPQPCRCRIAVARDEAFCFYYQVCALVNTHTCDL